MAIPQLILFMDSDGTLRAEAPSTNGSRRKIAIIPGLELASIREALYEQRDAIRDREAAIQEANRKAEIRVAHKDFHYIKEVHGIALAERVIKPERRPQGYKINTIGADIDLDSLPDLSRDSFTTPTHQSKPSHQNVRRAGERHLIRLGI